MKLAAKISSIILLILLLLVPTTAVSFDQEYPEFINGERVIFVQNSENTCWLDSNDVVLTILDDSNSIEESMAKFSDYLSNHQLPEGWSIEVIGGHGSSEEEFLRVHNSNNEAAKKSGPTKLVPIQLFTSSESSESTTSGYRTLRPTFAIDATSDPSSETITYIDAEWIAPQVGDYQTYHSALLVNGFTDESWGDYDGYFLQSGQLYSAGEGYHVWSDFSEGLEAQYFDIDYVAGHRCYYFVAKFTAGWYMGMGDYTSGQWDYVFDDDAVGDTLIKDIATSVFFENWNTNSNWYSGFTNPISVYNAYNGIAVPADIHQWNNDYIVILDSEGRQRSNGWIFKIISGRLRRFGTAKWNLHRILLAE